MAQRRRKVRAGNGDRRVLETTVDNAAKPRQPADLEQVGGATLDDRELKLERRGPGYRHDLVNQRGDVRDTAPRGTFARRRVPGPGVALSRPAVTASAVAPSAQVTIV